MTAWFLFGILAFLVFGMPSIDDLYKMKVRRRAGAASQIPDESPSSRSQRESRKSDRFQKSRFAKVPEKV